ncbi:uncharacterized protein LOC144546570, partial [Carex rostrata]
MAENGSASMEDNTTTKLTGIILNGKNYLPWARAAMIALKGRGTYGYVTGDKKKPTANSETWEKIDSNIMTSILNSIEPKLSEQFVYLDTSAQMWEKIKQRFGKQNNFAHIFQIKQDIIQNKQNQKPITQFFGEIQKQWDELDIHQPEVIDADKIRERKEQDLIFQFLANLDPSFEQVRQQILLGSSLPPLVEIVSLLEQEESRRSAMNSDTHAGDIPENQAFLSNHQNQARNPRGEMRGAHGKAKCEQCKKEGHDRDHCWFLHPHLRPKWWKGDKGGQNRTGGDKGERRGDRSRDSERRALACDSGSDFV